MSGESYNNAYSVLENRRLAMRAKYFAKQDEINKKVPQVSQLTDEINHLGASYTLAVLGKNKLNVYYGTEVFQFSGSKRFNALKYVNIYYRWKNIKEGDINGKFLGL